MSKQQRNNSGVLFRNENKTSEKAPDYSGTLVLDGIEKRIAGWVNISDKVGKYLSIEVSEIRNQQGRKAVGDEVEL